MTEQSNVINGTVEAVVYRNDANSYTILDVYSEERKEVVTVVGIMPFVGEGEAVEVRGEWVFHPEYGKQFRADSFEKRLPQDTNAILKYLSSGIIKGIGPKTAAKIVEKYGAETLDVMSEHPDWIAEFKGITARKALEISEQVRQQTTFYKLFDFCRDRLPMTVALRIHNAYGDKAIEVMKSNPYKLCSEIDGFTFAAADAIAVEGGYDPEGRERVFGATVQVLKLACESGGHAGLPVKTVITEVAELINVDAKNVAEFEKEFALCGEIGYLKREDGALLYLNEFLAAEKAIARQLHHLDGSCVRYDLTDMEAMLRRVEIESGIEFAEQQRKAIFTAAFSGVTVVTGGPGTGKTTIIKALMRIYESMGCDVALAAPTGRAAKRMSEATSHEAKTIHRLLEVEYCDDDGGASFFARNERNLLDEDIIIIDEASMIDMFLLNSLLRAIRPGARFVMIGDCDQLPSVGAGNVLQDIIDSDAFSVVKLTQVFRQGKESLIVTNAHKINHGEKPVLDKHDMDFFFMRRESSESIVNTLTDLCVNRLPKTYGASVFDRIQVITPTKKGGAGTESLNRILQQILNPASAEKAEKKHGEVTFRVCDKVMQVRNNYDLMWLEGGKERFGIYNGDIGVIKKIVDNKSHMVIDFEGREVQYPFDSLADLEHAYAITVHKSQGSEYPIVVMPITDFPPMLMTRNLIYTAVTRAKSMAVLVGRESALMQMVENKQKSVRHTGLKTLLEAVNA
ncbi:MAG: ATP-dependent RecD-like DNA helicase [Clostridia bacterium]|nr:ATP-dependent RecD-like DNA helicase [Clostridia bacterium]